MGLELVESEPLTYERAVHAEPPSCPADILRLCRAVCRLQSEGVSDFFASRTLRLRALDRKVVKGFARID